MRKIRSFFRHQRDAYRYLFRNGWMTSASILMMTLTLFLTGLLMVFVGNVDRLTKAVEGEIQVRVLIDPIASPEEIKALEGEISQLDEVSQVTFQTAEEELETYKEFITEDFDVLNDQNPLNDMFLVNVKSAKNIESISQRIEQMDYVLSANIGSLDLKGFIKTIDIGRYVLAILAGSFVIIAILLISNSIRMTINARSAEINIMRLVGAKRGYIRAPFTIEGFIIGVIGSLLASFLLFVSYQTLLNLLQKYLSFNPKYALPLWPDLVIIMGIMLVLACVIGYLAARRAVRKHLN